MLLITARLGLRASDVCCLRFAEIDWEYNRISIEQKKTGEHLELPLLPEIGEAIVDYMKHGRPVSDLPYIFLHANSPYDMLSRSTLHSIVVQYMRLAGINLGKRERKSGPHALRHSLAGILLEKKTPLPVISEVLGHKNTESTRHYIRIDIDALRQCTLDTPPIATGFYGKEHKDVHI
jgi:integrase